MKLKLMLLAVLGLLVFAGLAQAQQGFSSVWYWFDNGTGEVPLANACTAGTPLPDGTTVRFYWDVDSDGPDDTDPQPTLCAAPPNCDTGPSGTVNRQEIQLNGDSYGLGPGWFAMDGISFSSVGTITPNRFYMRVCTGSIRWQSNVVVLTPGPHEVGPGLEIPLSFTCLNQPCVGCSSPNGPSAMAASDSLCNGVNVTWTAAADTSNDGYKILRGGVPIATITNPALQQYLDTAAPEGESNYGVKVIHICGVGDTALSPTSEDLGHRLPPPPPVLTMTATDANCGYVRVDWTFGTNNGLGWWVITRDGDSVGTVNNSGQPGSRSFTHTTSLGAQASYCVRAAAAACGWGTPMCDNGTALQAPPQVQNVAATDGACTVTTVTWTDVAGETGYIVTRDGTNVSGTLGAGTTSWPDATGAAGTVYAYRVQASNTCGLSLNSAPDNGYRLIAPPTPTSFNAADSVNCSMVALTWSDVTNETYYKIMRGTATPTDSIGSAAANATSYNDSTAVPGTVYQYAVAAVNACGATQSAANAGSRKAVPAQVAGVSATDVNCGAVIVTWSNVANEDSFQVRRDGTRIGRTLANILQYNDSTATPGTTYAYTVVAYNSCGAGAVSLPDNGTRPPGLPAPAGMTASTNNCATVLLSWQNITGEDSFQVRRDGTRIGKTNADVLTYNDSTAVPGTTYAYTVVGYNACGAGTVSAPANGSRLPAMPAVANVVASDTICANVTITWTDPTGEDSVQIRRDGVRIGRTTGSVATFTDATATPGQTYMYRAVAYNTCGAGDTTGANQGTRGTTPGQVLNVAASDNRCDSLVVTWDAVAGASLYHIFRTAVEVGTSSTNRFAHVPATGTAAYTVTAENVCGQGAVSASDNGTRLVSPTPPTVIASDTSCAGINVAWSGAGGDVDSFRVYREATLITTQGPLVSSFFDVFVEVGTASYTVAAVSNECGASAASNSASGTRLAVPGVPQNVVATDSRCDSVIITWTAASGHVDSYKIYENSTDIGTVPANGVLRMARVPLSPGTYTYYVQGYSTECGYGTASPGESGTQAVAPTAASNLQASTIFCDRIDFSWTAGTGGIDGYIIYRDDTDIDTVDAGTTNYSDTGASVGSHNYYVVAYSVSCPDAEPSNTDDGQRVAFPTAPTGVAASDTSCALVYVVWTAIAEPHDYYVIYANGDSVGSTTGTSFNYAPTPGTIYSYTVKARSSCGLSAASTADNGQRLPGAGVPTNLTASDNDCDAILLTWNTASGFIEEYRIYRDGSFLIAQSAPDTTYSDVVTAGVTHTYEVSAYNSGCGETARSASDTGMRRPLLAQVQNLTASTTNCTGIALSWTGQAGASKYYIYRTTALYDSVLDPTTTYLDTGVSPGQSFTYNVSAVNICGAGAQSADATGQRVPTPLPVTTVDAVSDSCRRITVTWTDVSGETGYIIQRDHVTIDSVGPDVVLYYDRLAGLHTYHVLSKNICGYSALADSGSATAPDFVQPPTNVAATDNRCDSVIVTWTGSANATFYSVWRDGQLLQNNITGTLRYADAPNVGTYVYGVAAHNLCGQGGLITDSGTRRGPPAQVTGLAASDTSCTQICLTWNDVADEDSFRIYRDGNNFLAYTAANVTNYCDATATVGTHTYYVIAANVCGSATQSTTATGTRNTVPGQVQNFAASTNNCAGVVLTWTDLATESSYAIFRDGNPTPIATPAQNATTYTDDGVAMGNHTYTIHGVNACGNGQGPDASANGARRDVPGQVTGLTATDNGCSNITLNWNNLANEDSFRVYRESTYIGYTAVDVTTYIDNVSPGAYTYYVIAANVCGSGLQSVNEQGTRLPVLPQVPGVTATDNICANVLITWGNIAGEDSFQVRRNGTRIGGVAPDVLTFTDATGTPGTAYTYRVVAYNLCGAGDSTGSDQGTRRSVPAAPGNVVASDNNCNGVVVTWNNVADEDSFQITRNGTPVGMTLTDVLTFTDNTAVPGTTYSYCVNAYNACGVSTNPNCDNGTRATVPAQVTGVTATDNRCDAVVITWANLAGEDSFQVRRNGNRIGVTLTDVLTFTDNTAVPGTPYPYTVVAYGPCGGGQESAQDNGIRLVAPIAPTGVAASDNLCGTVHITWGFGGGVVDTFIIMRGNTEVGRRNEDLFQFDDPAPVGTYQYTVVAHSNGQVCPDATSTADPGTSHAAPGVPTNLQVSTVNCDSVGLSWTASTGEVVGYSIFRDSDSLTSVTAIRYADMSLLDNDNHTYQVRAYNNFCAPSNLTGGVVGRMRDLLLAPTIPATVLCEDTITVNLDHCAGVTSDTVAISINGGAYEPLVVFSPVQAQVDIIIPDVQQTMPNNRLRIISTRGARRDTVITDPFTIECLAANDQISEIPTDFVLEQNYPNPFNPSTTIKFGVPVTAEVTVEIFDVQGRRAAMLLDNQTLQPGWHSVVWDCSQCPSGMYLVRMQAGERTMLRKMLLMK